jgi:hypothetical protein
MDTKRKLFTFGLTMIAGFVAIIILAFTTAGCWNNAAGYRALTVTVKVGNETGKTLAVVCKAKRVECVKKYGAVRTPELEECIRTCYKALDAWVKVVKPAISSSVAFAFGGLETARAAKKTDSTWIDKLKPGACALVRAVTEWRDMLGKKAEGFLNLLGSVEGFVCSK